ncbi:alpha/beta hydrolase [Flavobacterium sp.]|uniref:alpha/beta hydrolase n=1 Tax=Flavobacterium sp. TaxID=239 RepID=UPI00352781D3
MKRKKNLSTIPKPILWLAKFLEKVAPSLAVSFASRLFVTPIKYKIPKREFEMEKQSQQVFINVPSLNKTIRIYHYGNSPKKVLLVHGWSGRGTQLVKIADMLVAMGYSTISFDAPAHGKSPGKTTVMIEFIASILTIEKQFGPFEFCIGHSLGGMATLNAIKQGLQVKKAVIISSGNSVTDILLDFVSRLELQPKIAEKMKYSFEEKYNLDMESYSAYVAAKHVAIPVLVIHDQDDDDVPVSASESIHKHLENSQLLITKKLGHRKILGDANVLKKIKQFLEN